MDDDENEQALQLLDRAEADAELARALAKEQVTRDDADEALKALEKLKKGKL